VTHLGDLREPLAAFAVKVFPCDLGEASVSSAVKKMFCKVKTSNAGFSTHCSEERSDEKPAFQSQIENRKSKMSLRRTS
jgi:hypothetical protein